MGGSIWVGVAKSLLGSRCQRPGNSTVKAVDLILRPISSFHHSNMDATNSFVTLRLAISICPSALAIPIVAQSDSISSSTACVFVSQSLEIFNSNAEIKLTKQLLILIQKKRTMITVSIEPGRLHRASTQPFRLMKTNVNRAFIVLGSTGNACVVAVRKRHMCCNCPDSHSTCKHILFILSLCGFSGRSQLSFSPTNLLRKLHADPPSRKLKRALLDEHTKNLCSSHLCPSCYFCNQRPSGTLTICSTCGFLSHEHCFQAFLLEDDDDGSHCPRCGTMSSRLPSHSIRGHRNFFHVLRHQGHPCIFPNNLDAAHDDPPADEHETLNEDHPAPPQFHLHIAPESAESNSGLISVQQPPQDL